MNSSPLNGPRHSVVVLFQFVALGLLLTLEWSRNILLDSPLIFGKSCVNCISDMSTCAFQARLLHPRILCPSSIFMKANHLGNSHPIEARASNPDIAWPNPVVPFFYFLNGMMRVRASHWN